MDYCELHLKKKKKGPVVALKSFCLPLKESAHTSNTHLRDVSVCDTQEQEKDKRVAECHLPGNLTSDGLNTKIVHTLPFSIVYTVRDKTKKDRQT